MAFMQLYAVLKKYFCPVLNLLLSNKGFERAGAGGFVTEGEDFQTNRAALGK